MLDEPLKALEDEFGDRFVRIHRNALVARDRIERLQRTPLGHFQLYLRGLGGEALTVSRRHVAGVRKLMQKPLATAAQRVVRSVCSSGQPGDCAGPAALIPGNPAPVPEPVIIAGSSTLELPMSREIRIATRKSALALWQAEYVKARLEAAHPGLKVSLLPMVSRGDKMLDAPLAKIGGKGLFVKELETALLENEADIAVHSMKDVPMDFPEGLGLSCICEREDPRDAFVSNTYATLDELPAGSVVGTSSLRRQASCWRAVRI